MNVKYINIAQILGANEIEGVKVLAIEKVFPMTQAGKEKLEQELENLKTVKRKEVVERIKIARSFGDLSENSEYDSAKEEQAFVEGRITTLENMIRNAKIIAEDDISGDSVSLGRSVTFVELPDGEEETYTIVGSAEADPFEGKISNDSPIAKSLIGKKIDDEVTVQTPGGEMNVRIVTIK
ncbi:transcription elongation factor GreA [Cytobacillus purgationiresistens]|uniref:Transcription elongation factor GreA n=1 Tax=Cytobacillus purgationiresistens TaxID=863449 RepID=A0ABU0AE65_9BACI|nr:transcription elongation factor GreA [Cytobacillus purgationiresistens]